MSEYSQMLHKILRSTWNNLNISEQWMKADVYIPKEQYSTEIDQFRPISLLNLEGKIIFFVMESCLTKCLIENGYVNVSVQRGVLQVPLGYPEEAKMIWMLPAGPC
ncbi:reverse transcriptase [Plakobranchus ocellatus]|uniref:Reverse transcriptase n=1 Tax=Plakobranchus ocellatus TaxID=259542 RepID=A0AAV4C828_9GAST|nr:reverse transcriptase [Plakobranchus ocellatus]